MTPPIFATAHVEAIRDVAYLRAMEAHGRGEGAMAELRRRDGATHRAVAFVLTSGGKYVGGVDGGNGGRGFEVLRAFGAFKREHGIRELKGARIGLHAIIGVSAAWVADAVAVALRADQAVGVVGPAVGRRDLVRRTNMGAP